MAAKKTLKNGASVERFDDFDDFLRDRGIERQVKAAVEKRIIAMQLDERRIEAGISKAELARRVGTSRTQIDRILDPRSQNVTIETLGRVAAVMGKRLHLELVD
jgi:DNA-binding Xre family transcriptional regulator